MSHKCNHLIGFTHDEPPVPLYVKLLNYTLAELVKHNIRGNNLKYKLKYLDKRCGYAILFDYCPICGSKINLSEIRKEIV